MATIYEVSTLAGVSLATVSRVMNNSAHVTDKTRQKVLSAMAELGYRPNSIAQSLASNRSNSVGILVPELHGPFFSTILSGIEAELRGARKHVIITVGHSDKEKEIDGIEFLMSRNCDALILHVDAVSDPWLVELSAGSTPIVLINRSIPAMASNCINLDNEHGGYVATKSLLELGHRDIAYISGPQWKKDANERLVGHKKALSEYGVRFNKNLMFEGDFHESGGSKGMAQLLQTGIRFSAVICGNDDMAAGAMDVARENGLAIPDDVSVVGFDNVNFAHFTYPKLSTVDYPMNDMGQMAARWVLKNVYEQGGLEIQNTFRPELISRASTGPLDR
ncbi:MAG: LacI family DNA-binding transcriptional regulator [Woeseia sp.]